MNMSSSLTAIANARAKAGTDLMSKGWQKRVLAEENLAGDQPEPSLVDGVK